MEAELVVESGLGADEASKKFAEGRGRRFGVVRLERGEKFEALAEDGLSGPAMEYFGPGLAQCFVEIVIELSETELGGRKLAVGVGLKDPAVVDFFGFGLLG